jgi:hypothetical protein
MSPLARRGQLSRSPYRIKVTIPDLPAGDAPIVAVTEAGTTTIQLDFEVES